MVTVKIIVLAIHNILRWVILGLGILTIVRMVWGWVSQKIWTPFDKKIQMFFVIALDSQLLVGLLLYFVFSDITKAAFANFGTAMNNSILRFFSLEHLAILIPAIFLAHYTSSSVAKESNQHKKFRKSALLYTIVMLLIISGIPWASRPLLPGF